MLWLEKWPLILLLFAPVPFASGLNFTSRFIDLADGHPVMFAPDKNLSDIVYVTSWAHVDTSQEQALILKLNLTSKSVVTYAGADKGCLDGPLTSAKFSRPRGLVCTSSGDIYVLDTHNERVRKLSAGGVVSTIAGSVVGHVDGSSARFNRPQDAVLNEDTQSLILVEKAGFVRRVNISNGTTVTISGVGTGNPIDGPFTTARFKTPRSIAADWVGNFWYVADSKGNSIRELDLQQNMVNTIAGSASSGLQDGIGATARFYRPQGLIYRLGNLYVAERNNNAVRQINVATKETWTLAGGAAGSADGLGTYASFKEPFGVMMFASADSPLRILVADHDNKLLRTLDSCYSVEAVDKYCTDQTPLLHDYRNTYISQTWCEDQCNTDRDCYFFLYKNEPGTGSRYHCAAFSSCSTATAYSDGDSAVIYSKKPICVVYGTKAPTVTSAPSTSLAPTHSPTRAPILLTDNRLFNGDFDADDLQFTLGLTIQTVLNGVLCGNGFCQQAPQGWGSVNSYVITNPNTIWGTSNSGNGVGAVALQGRTSKVYQTFQVIAGRQYVVSARVAQRLHVGGFNETKKALVRVVDGGSDSTIDLAKNEFLPPMNGTGATNAANWANITLQFTAISSRTTLFLENACLPNGDFTIFVDDAKVLLLPSLSPTTGPSSAPTNNPTCTPTTASPSSAPTSSPTIGPSSAPTNNPTSSPTTASPSSTPTSSPVSASPTRSPSTASPVTLHPVTGAPATQHPQTLSPATSSPTGSPSLSPTTAQPGTSQPSSSPSTQNPHFLTYSPTQTRHPSLSPATFCPSASPQSMTPSRSPSCSPTSGSPVSHAPSVSPNTPSPSSRAPSRSPSSSAPSSYSPVTTHPSTDNPSQAPSASPKTYSPITLSPSSLSPSSLSPSTMAPSEAAAAPIAREAFFHDAFRGLSVSFSTPTNTPNGGGGGGSNQRNCDGLLSAGTIAKLGAQPTCAWLETTRLFVSFGLGWDLDVHDVIGLNGGLIRGIGGNTRAMPLTVLHVTLPETLPKAEARLVGPSSVVGGSSNTAAALSSSCGNKAFSLDAGESFGNAGRPFIFHWSLVSISPPPSAAVNVQSLLAGACESANARRTASVLMLRAGNLSIDATHTFRVTVTNWLNSSSWADLNVTRREGGYEAAVLRPVFRIPGSAFIQLQPNAPLHIRVQVDLPTSRCAAAIGVSQLLGSSVEWSQITNPALLSPNTRSLVLGPASSSGSSNLTTHHVALTAEIRWRVYLFLPPGALRPGRLYGFKLRAATTDRSRNNVEVADASVSFLVQVLRLGPVVRILGGDVRTVSTAVASSSSSSAGNAAGSSQQQDFVEVDASQSYDPESYSSGGASQEAIRYEWRFYQLRGGASSSSSLGDDFLRLPSPSSLTSSRLKVPLHLLEPGKAYKAVVNVTTYDGRQGIAGQVLQVVQAAVPLVSVNLGGAASSSSGTGVRIDPSTKLTFEGSIEYTGEGALSYRWICTTKNFEMATNNLLTPLNSRNMVIKPNTLAGGTTYTFELTAATRLGAAGSATLSLATNSAPALGRCEATPKTGVALETVFTLRCIDWSDEDLPLQYRYERVGEGATGAVRSGSDTSLNRLEICALRFSDSYDTILPLAFPSASSTSSSDEGGDAVLVIAGIVIDALGARSESWFNVTTRPPAGTAVEALNATQQAITELLGIGDVQSATMLIAGASATLERGQRRSFGNDTVGTSVAVAARERAKLVSSVNEIVSLSISSATSNAGAEAEADAQARLTIPLVLLQDVTDFSDPREITSETRSLALDIVTRLMNVSSARPACSPSSSSSSSCVVANDMAPSLPLAAAAGAVATLGNLVVSTSSSSSASLSSPSLNTSTAAAEERRIATSMRATALLNRIADSQLTSSVPGEAGIEVRTPRANLYAKLDLANKLNGSVVATSFRTTVNVSARLPPMPDPNLPASLVITTVNDRMFPTNGDGTDGSGNGNDVNGSLANDVAASVQIRQNGLQVPINNLSSPFYITLPVASPSLTSFSTDGQQQQLVCQFWDGALSRWSRAGVRTKATTNEQDDDGGVGIVCETDHLTVFSTQHIQIEIQHVSAEDLTWDAFSWNNLVMVFSTLTLCVMAAVVVWAARNDHKIATTKGEQSSRQFWRKFNRMRRLRVSERSFSSLYRISVWNMRRRHPWSGIYMRHPGDFMSSTKRAIVLTALLFNMMACCALLLDTQQRMGPLPRRAAAGMISVLISFPVPFLLHSVFRRRVPEMFVVPLLDAGMAATFFSKLLVLLAFLSGETGGGGEEEVADVDGEESGENGNVDFDEIEIEEAEDDGGDRKNNIDEDGNDGNAVEPDSKVRDTDQENVRVRDTDQENVRVRDTDQENVKTATSSGVGIGSALSGWGREKGFFSRKKWRRKNKQGPSSHRGGGVQTSSETLESSACMVSASKTSKRRKLCCSSEFIGCSGWVKIYPSDPYRTDTHVWTYRDVFATAISTLVISGCWFLLVVISWRLRSSGIEWVLSNLLAFGQDFFLRAVQMFIVEVILFVPCCCLCCCRGDGDSGKSRGAASLANREHSVSGVEMANRGPERGRVYTVNFDPGMIGFKFCRLAVTHVNPWGQAANFGVRLGWKVVSVNNQHVRDDKEATCLLQDAHRVSDEIPISFLAQEELLVGTVVTNRGTLLARSVKANGKVCASRKPSGTDIYPTNSELQVIGDSFQTEALTAGYDAELKMSFANGEDRIFI